MKFLICNKSTAIIFAAIEKWLGVFLKIVIFNGFDTCKNECS